jgi:hypothetical protein
MSTSSTNSGLIPAFSIAPFMAILPRSVADKLDKAPPKLPIGVLTAETIYTSCIIKLKFGIVMVVK